MAENSVAGEFEEYYINNDDVIHDFKVNEKLDEGNYGQVFIVSKSGKRYAMKTEPKRLDGAAPALKTEIDVMMKLEKAKARYFPRFVFAGMEPKYHLLVMDLLGANLKNLRLQTSDPIASSPGTWCRVGIQCLYVLKQMHDHGFLHHDIKPGNFAMGPADDVLSSRVLHLFDFGISRPFIQKKKGAAVIGQKPTDMEFRRAKKKVKTLRGTPVYASLNAHALMDSGRVDDVWSLLYMIAEMVGPLPWATYEDQELEKHKRNSKLKDLFKDESFDAVEQMLRSCNFYSFPNYELIYKAFKTTYDKSRCTWLDPYDWETKQMPAYVRWMQQAEKRNTLFQWEYSDIASYFRQDPWNFLQEKREKKKEKKKIEGVDAPTLTVTAEAPTFEEVKTPKPVVKKEKKISKPTKTKTKHGHGKKN